MTQEPFEVWTYLEALHRFHVEPEALEPPPVFELEDGSFDSEAYLRWLNGGG